MLETVSYAKKNFSIYLYFVIIRGSVRNGQKPTANES